MACSCNAKNQEKYQELDAVIAEYINEPGSLINVRCSYFLRFVYHRAER